LKKEYMDDAVRDAAMMGVTAIQPLIAGHSAVTVRRGEESRLVSRWERIAVASVKQSGRATVPVVRSPQRFEDWRERDGQSAALRVILVEPAHATRRRAPDLSGWLSLARAGGGVLLVGPEGGWTSSEVASALAGQYQPWTVSERTLRADAMPIAALSVLFYAWECAAPDDP
jgi:16S rRNA (uracil1498-N3)-methyltransferase